MTCVVVAESIETNQVSCALTANGMLSLANVREQFLVKPVVQGIDYPTLLSESNGCVCKFVDNANDPILMRLPLQTLLTEAKE